MTWHKPTQSFSSPDNFFNILWRNTLGEGIDIRNDKYLQKNYDCKWVFCFQHDVWPLTKNFFTKFDKYRLC